MRRDRFLVVAVGVAIALALFGINWGLPSAYSWSNDDITPKMPLSIPAIWRSGHHAYPYLHAWLDRALYAPYLALLRHRGDLVAGCADLTKARCYAAPDEQLGVLILLARLLSVAMGAGIVAAVYAVALIAFRDRLAARMAALLAACCQVLVFHAHLGNLDTPSVFWFAVSLVFYTRLARGDRVRDYAALGVLAGCALATKESVIGAYALMAIAVAIAHVRRVTGGARRRDPRAVVRALADRQLVAGAIGVVAVYGFANNVLLNPSGYAQHVRFWIGGHGISGWNQGYTGQIPLLGTFAARLGEAIGWPLLLLCAAGTVWSLWRHRIAAWLLVPVVSYYLFTIVPIRYVYVRFTMPVVVVLVVFGGVLAADMWRWRGRGRGAARAVVALVVAHGLLYSVQSDLLMLRDARYAAEVWLVANVPREATVEAIGSKTYLPRLAYLGYGDERIPWEEMTPAGLARRAPDYIVLSSKSIAAADATGQSLVDDLLAGRGDYDVAFDARTRSPLARILGTSYVDSRVNPRVVVLRRRGAGG